MTQTKKVLTRKSDAQKKYRTTGYKVFKHKRSVVSFSASTTVTKSSHTGEGTSRRLAAYVYIEKRQHDNSHLPSPPSSGTPRSPGYITRALASQASSQHSELEISHARLAPRSSPTHSWTFSERQALCLYKRLYENGWQDLAALMNSTFPSQDAPFARYMLQSQYSDLKGWHCPAPRALAAYASVWRFGFDQLDATFAYRIARTTVQAASLGIDLRRRPDDEVSELRAAKNNHRTNPSLFEEPSFAQNDDLEREMTPMSLAGDEPPVKAEAEGHVREAHCSTPPSQVEYMLSASIQRHKQAKAKVTGPVLSSQLNLRVAMQRFATPSYPIPTTQTDENLQFDATPLPALLFRCVGPGTAGASSSRFIYSGRHAPFAGRPIHVPRDPEAMLDDCELHIGRHPIHSSMISTTQSLIWALIKFNHTPGDLSSKYLYVIDSAAANARTRVFPGHVLAKELRDRDRLKPSDILKAGDQSQTLSICNYKGFFDYLVYGEVSGPAIVKRVSLMEIEAFAKHCPHVSRFLRLHLFENVGRIRDLFLKLKNEMVELDSSAGIAIAKIMLFFGVGLSSGFETVAYFFYTLLQNWKIKVSNSERSHHAIHAFVETFAGEVVAHSDWLKLERCANDAITRWKDESRKFRSRK